MWIRWIFRVLYTFLLMLNFVTAAYSFGKGEINRNKFVWKCISVMLIFGMLAAGGFYA